MGRPIKQGLDYFPHDTDASSDEKIESLRALYKNDGYTFYFITLERIYRSNNGELDLSSEEERRILAKKIGITLKKFEKILHSSFQISLYDLKSFQKKSVLTSPGIKKRFSQIRAERERKRKYYNKSKVVLDVKKGGRKASKRGGETPGETPQSKVKHVLIELAQTLVKEIKKESSFYAIVNKYISALGEDKVLKILSDYNQRKKWFDNENNLAAYLEACTRNNGQGKITDNIPEIKEGEGVERWMQ